MYGMIIVLLIFLSGCAGSSIFSRTPDVSINANDLKQSYTSNELETIVELGDYIEITGVISFISSDEDEVMIQLYGDVLCSVTSNTESVEELELHNKIVLTGTIDGFTEDGKLVLVKKCKLVEVVTKPDIVTDANDISNLDFDETAY